MKIEIITEYYPIYHFYKESNHGWHTTPIVLDISEEKAADWKNVMENFDRVQKEMFEEIMK